MLYLLQGAAGAFVLIGENPSGDWSFRVPLEGVLPATAQRPVAQQIRSIDFDMPRSDVVTFTFSLPLFWAIMLAAPGVRRNLRALLLGTALMSAIEVALLLLFAQITARNAVSQLAGVGDADGKWLRHVGEYMVVNVLPYAVPFVAALSLHRELREAVLPLTGEAEAAAVARPMDRAERRRAKHPRR